MLEYCSWFGYGSCKSTAAKRLLVLQYPTVDARNAALKGWLKMLKPMGETADQLADFFHPQYLPSSKLTRLWKITIPRGKISYEWPCSIAMLVYQRVLLFVSRSVFAEQTPIRKHT